ncbi:MAG TPA: hypothetical protein PLL20_07840 [Phycisphaerae bacterium]|nr:hypothetical protein [Phycisphaerae bacterium]HRR86321.1 hypothetical protein [Phycisphaerae bacterium]
MLGEGIRETLSRILESQNLFPLALLVALTTYLLWTSRRKLRQHANQPKRSTPQREPEPVSPGSKEQLRRDLESLIAELEQLSRKISAEIDTRFAKLEAAMHDADRRIAALHRLTQQQEGSTARMPAREESEGAKPASDRPEDRYALIYELTDVGFSPVEIARDLGRTPGEVELILNLRNRGRPKAPDSPS